MSLAFLNFNSFCVTLATSQSRHAITWGGLGGRTQNGCTSRSSCSSKALRCSSVVLSLSLFSWSFSSLSWSSACFSCNLFFSSWSATSFSCNLVSLSWSSASFVWRSWVSFWLLVFTLYNSSVGKLFCLLTAWILEVDRPRARNAVSTFPTVTLKSAFESWPSVIWAKPSFRNFLRSSTLVLNSGLRPCPIESEYRMA